MFLCFAIVMAEDSFNHWQLETDLICPYGQAISTIYSQYSDSIKDRRYRCDCKDVGATYDCSDKGNFTYRQSGYYDCPKDQVITGIRAGQQNYYNFDRLFHFICCKVLGKYTTNCNDEVMIKYSYHEKYHVPREKFITRFESSYNNFERQWNVRVCNLKAKNKTQIYEECTTLKN